MLNRRDIQKILNAIQGEIDDSQDPFMNSAEAILRVLAVTNKDYYLIEFDYPFVGEHMSKKYKMTVNNSDSFAVYMSMALQQAKINDADKYPYYVSFLSFDLDNQDVVVKVCQLASEEEEIIFRNKLEDMGIPKANK